MAWAHAMQSRWSEAEAHGKSDLDQLIYASRLIGAEESLVLWGGGNTSVKVRGHDFRGHEKDIMWIKGSGSDLKTIEAKHFAGVVLDDVRPLASGQKDMDDDEMVAYLANCLTNPKAPRPSIETLLHGFLSAKFIIHTHADLIEALTNNENGEQAVKDVFGEEAVVVPYQRPGFKLSKMVHDAVGAKATAKFLILRKHGLITWGTTAHEAYERTIEAITRVEHYIERLGGAKDPFAQKACEPLPPALREKVYVAVAANLRGLLSRPRRVVTRFDDSPDVLEFVSAKDAKRLSQIGPATPDHVLSTRVWPAFIDWRPDDGTNALGARLKEGIDLWTARDEHYYKTHADGKLARLDPYPRVILIPGLGMVTAGTEARRARIIAGIYHHTINVIKNAERIAPYVSLTEAEAFHVDYWPLELYKLTLAPPEKEFSRRIVLVTGGGSGIGRVAAERFAEAGAHVVVTDLVKAAADQVAQEIVKKYPDRALSIVMNVTEEASVQEAFEVALFALGGVDVVFSNAGIAISSPIESMKLDDWHKSHAVNATGHFLVVREALKIMRAQGLGGSIVFNASKNVTAPGKDFGAYSAAKAAAAQLCRIIAIEGAEYGVRANMVNPDAVFQGTQLWSQEMRESRAKAQGIEVDKIEDFYKGRSLLKQPVLPDDVADAVLFLASDRSAKTTGAMIPVDGGVVGAFPR
jgi:rhamnulose-1-phosphate aldolase/alcohol dehydrogenase